CPPLNEQTNARATMHILPHVCNDVIPSRTTVEYGPDRRTKVLRKYAAKNRHIVLPLTVQQRLRPQSTKPHHANFRPKYNPKFWPPARKRTAASLPSCPSCRCGFVFGLIRLRRHSI